jgi:mono/diheme cytochrome c family protein
LRFIFSGRNFILSLNQNYETKPMKKFFKVTGIVLGGILVFILLFALYIQIDGIPKYAPPVVDLKVEITPERIAQGQKIASMECIACHAAEDGKLTGRYLKELPKEFGEIYSRNITNDKELGIGTWTDGEIYALLRTGIKRDGQYIPPYMAKFPLASDEDLYSVIAWLRSDSYGVQATPTEAPESKPSFLVKFLSHVAFKPLPYEGKPIAQADTNDVVAHGKYLATAVYGCYACHSADFKTMNEVEPEKSGGFFGGGNQMTDLNGNVIVTTNLTFDNTGIAQYNEGEFIQAVKTGRKRSGAQTRYPMFPHTQLTDNEVSAIFAYLKTVPKISNPMAQVN